MLGWASNHFLRRSETELGRSQFAAIAERALAGAQDALLRRRSGAATVASLYSNLFPDAEQWPFVSIPRYNAIATEISFTSSGFSGEDENLGQGLGVAQIVIPDQVDEFNEFQKDYLNTYFPPARPVFSLPPVVLADGRVVPLPPSQYNITVPLSAIYGPQTGGDHAMLDLFSTPLYRPIIDQYLRSADSATAADSNLLKCGILSRPVIAADDDPSIGPKSLYTHPICPTNDPSTVCC